MATASVPSGLPTAGPSSSDTISLPDNLQRLLLDVKENQIAHLAEAARTGTLDEAERTLHETLSRIESGLGIWAIDVVDMGRNAAEREAWNGAVRRAKDDVAGLRRRATEALMEARRRRQSEHRLSAQEARNALFGDDMSGSAEERQRRRDERISNQTADEQLMTASGDVTAALQRAVQLMSTELEKSSYSAQLLDESTVSVQQATLQYTSFTTLVASSRKLITSMERADLVDAAFLLLSLLFFVGCILYILKVRIWDRGVGILSFFFRLFGLASSRSSADVKEKLLMAREAAKSSSLSFAAQMTASALSASAAAASSAASASSASASSAAEAAIEQEQKGDQDRPHDEL